MDKKLHLVPVVTQLLLPVLRVVKAWLIVSIGNVIVYVCRMVIILILVSFPYHLLFYYYILLIKYSSYREWIEWMFCFQSTSIQNQSRTMWMQFCFFITTHLPYHCDTIVFLYVYNVYLICIKAVYIFVQGVVLLSLFWFYYCHYFNMNYIHHYCNA